METTYRLNTNDLNMAFVNSLKSLFNNQDIEVTVRPVPDTKDIANSDWLKEAGKNPAFDFLHDESENIYSLNDGKPFINEK